MFEQGFSEQLYEILNCLPYNKQSLLLTATLPQSVIRFSKAGLLNPTLLKLDSNIKLSPNLKVFYYYFLILMLDELYTYKNTRK